MKFIIAKILNLSKKSCWANLVLWSKGMQDWESIWEQRCTSGNCYCGKCDKIKYINFNLELSKIINMRFPVGQYNIFATLEHCKSVDKTLKYCEQAMKELVSPLEIYNREFIDKLSKR